MTTHIFMPEVLLQKGLIHPAYEQYLKEWREAVINQAEAGEVAASTCQQATFVDLVLFGQQRHDWLSIMDDLLMDNGRPLAYSKEFAKRLYKFDNQYLQSTIHAIHTRWWLECVSGNDKVDHARFAALVLSKKQTDGLIYDKDVSDTILRHRMKCELTMSMAFAIEILQAADMLQGDTAIQLATDIVSPTKCPVMGYMSMEYFRLKALRLLGHERLFPVGIAEHIQAATAGLSVGWCDFSIVSKVDPYMGTAKRTQRDKPIHSPLIACQVATLFDEVDDPVKKNSFNERKAAYACFLKANPLDIPAFQMRDVPIRFGTDKTPIEVICASHLISLCQNN